MSTFIPDVAKTSTTDTAATVGLITQDARILASMPNTLITTQQTPTVTLQEIAALSVTQPGSVLKAIITPEVAKSLLANINTANRPLSAARVKQYADVFKRGQYVFNGESIQVGIDSANRLILLNGQHRLSACVMAGASFETVLVVGLPTDVFSTIDRGKTRSHSDVLSVAGFKNTHNIQPAARILVAMEAGFSPAIRSTMNLITAEDILQYVRANEEVLMDAHTIAGRISAVAGGIQSAWIIFYVHAYQQRVQAGFSGQEVAEFCKAIETGASLKHLNPALALRQWLGRGGSKRKGASGKNVAEAATFITTFNKWVEGASLQQVRPWSAEASEFPAITSSGIVHSPFWS
jgi:hypothetical protein